MAPTGRGSPAAYPLSHRRRVPPLPAPGGLPPGAVSQLFWQYGLLATMVAHMLYHLVWLPFDLRYYRRAESPLVT